MKNLKNNSEFWSFLTGVNVGVIVTYLIDTILKWLNIH